MDRAHSIWFARPREVEIREEPLPDLGPEDLRVRALVSGISHGTEMLVYRGQVPPELPLDLPTFAGSFRFPVKHSYANVGRVVQRGSEVADIRPGDLVFALHPHQTEYVLPAALAVPLPPDLPPEIGIFTANLETAVTVTLDAHPRLGERIVIFGQGVVGLLLTQLLRRTGVDIIIAVEPAPRRAALARSLGADTVLSPGDDLPERIRDLTGGAGADLALEASGQGAALDSAIESVAFGGTVVVCSWYGTKEVPLHLGRHFHRGRVRILSSQVGTIDPALQPRWNAERRQTLVRTLLSNLQLAPLISHRFPFRNAADAYALIDSGAEETVQVVLTY